MKRGRGIEGVSDDDRPADFTPAGRQAPHTTAAEKPELSPRKGFEPYYSLDLGQRAGTAPATLVSGKAALKGNILMFSKLIK